MSTAYHAKYFAYELKLKVLRVAEILVEVLVSSVCIRVHRWLVDPCLRLCPAVPQSKREM
jgi:hypothetical protein